MNLSHVRTERAAHLATFPARTSTNARLPLAEAMREDLDRLRRNFDLTDRDGNYLAGCEQAAVDALAYLYRLTPEQAWTAWIRHAATVTPA
jgi:hypothetical protein